MKKTYLIKNEYTDWYCKVEIDHDHITKSDDELNGFTVEQNMALMLQFWTDEKRRISFFEGNIIHAFLGMLAEEVYKLAFSGSSVYGIRNAIKEMEGWCDIAGKYGITLVYVEEVELSITEWGVEEVNK